MIQSEDGQTSVTAAAQGSRPGDTVRYALEVPEEGVQSQESLSGKLKVLQHSFKMLEPGTGAK
jgi:hypothetical protein